MPTLYLLAMGHVSKYLVLLLILLYFVLIAMVNTSFAIENNSITENHEQNINIQNSESVQEIQTVEKSKRAGQQSNTKNSSISWNNRAVPMMSRLFVWIGFIISIGLTAKILTAFNDQKIGLLTVIFVGCVGALVSMIFLPCLLGRQNFQPISPIGFIVAVIIAFLILTFYSKILNMLGKENI